MDTIRHSILNVQLLIRSDRTHTLPAQLGRSVPITVLGNNLKLCKRVPYWPSPAYLFNVQRSGCGPRQYITASSFSKNVALLNRCPSLSYRRQTCTAERRNRHRLQTRNQRVQCLPPCNRYVSGDFFSKNVLKDSLFQASEIVAHIQQGEWTASEVVEAYIHQASVAHAATNCVTEGIVISLLKLSLPLI